jgi:lysophospholipase L1-like esterase
MTYAMKFPTHLLNRVQRGAWIAVALSMSLLPVSPSLAGEAVRVLVYGDSNTWGWRPVNAGFPTDRYIDGQRWSGVMQRQLGKQYTVVVDGLSGRTVDVDYPDKIASLTGDQFNGERTLRSALAREAPVHLVVIMLGTNDLRDDLNRSPEQIAAGISRLVGIVRTDFAGVFTTYRRPEVLVVVPPAIGAIDKTPIKQFFANASDKSKRLSAAVQAEANGNGYAMFDAERATRLGGVDGIHMTAADHRRLGAALAGEVVGLLGRKARSTKRLPVSRPVNGS